MTQEPELITVYFPSSCLSCEETVHIQEEAYWVPEVGVWHKGCPKPKNLARYVKDASRAQHS